MEKKPLVRLTHVATYCFPYSPWFSGCTHTPIVLVQLQRKDREVGHTQGVKGNLVDKFWVRASTYVL